MRHIPEDELHAYLDQGLSRSQCVEIESHLAACPVLPGRRDGIAALRDRTTALLARLAPPRGFPPAFESLAPPGRGQASRAPPAAPDVAWAASLVVAVGLGWTASYSAHQAANPRPRIAVSRPSPSVRPRTAHHQRLP